MLERHAEQVVNLVELGQRHVDEPAPTLPRLRVTRLQALKPAAALGGEVGVSFGFIARPYVQGVELHDVLDVRRIVPAEAFVGSDQQPERRAPIAQMVIALDGVAARLQNLLQSMPDHGRADVMKGQFLGDVRA